MPQNQAQTVLAQSSLAHAVPSTEVTGNIADWEKRLTEEKRNAFSLNGDGQACLFGACAGMGIDIGKDRVELEGTLSASLSIKH